jgi:hypothetical protein
MDKNYIYFYERNIVEIKNEYTDFLVNIMIPLVYEGFKGMYDKSVLLEQKFRQKELEVTNFQNPGIFKIFQICLKDIQNLNNYSIDEEVKRIKEKGKCSDFFDDLVKATIKSYIVLLSFNASGRKSRIIQEKHHENVDVNMFIHKCYIECAKIFFNYPELFWHKFSTLDIKRNQREAYDLIKAGIIEAIKKMLPIKLILKDYLKADVQYPIDINNNQNHENKFINMKNLIRRDLDENYDSDMNGFRSSEGGGNNAGKFTLHKIIDSDEQDKINYEIHDLEKDVKKVDNLENESNLNFNQLLLTSTNKNSENKSRIIMNEKIDNEEKSDESKNQFKIIEMNLDNNNKGGGKFFKDEMAKFSQKLKEENNSNKESPKNSNKESPKDKSKESPIEKDSQKDSININVVKKINNNPENNEDNIEFKNEKNLFFKNLLGSKN